jgi:hypothetical protein
MTEKQNDTPTEEKEIIPDDKVWSFERQWKKKKEIPPEIPDEAA